MFHPPLGIDKMRLLTALVLAATLSVSLSTRLVQPVAADPLPAYMQSASAGLESIPLADFSYDEGPAAVDFSQAARREEKHEDDRDRYEGSDRSKEDDDRDDRRGGNDDEEVEEEDEEELEREIGREEDAIDRESARRFVDKRWAGRNRAGFARRGHRGISSRGKKTQQRLKGLIQLRKRLAGRIRSERTQLARRGSRKPNNNVRRAQRQLKTISGLIAGVRKGRPAALRAVNNLEREDSRIADLVNAPSKLPLKKFVEAAQKRTSEIRNRALIAVRTIDRHLRRQSVAVRRLQRTRQLQIRRAQALIKRVQAEIMDRYRIEREKLGRQLHKLRNKLRRAQSALSASSSRSHKMMNQARVHALKARVAGMRAKAVQRRSEVHAVVARIRGGMAKVTSIKPPRMPGQVRLEKRLRKLRRIAGIRKTGELRPRDRARGRGRRRAVGSRRGRRAGAAQRGRRGRGRVDARRRGRRVASGRRVSPRSAGKHRTRGLQQRRRVARDPQRVGARRGVHRARAGNRPARGGGRQARPHFQRKVVSRKQQQQRQRAKRKGVAQKQAKVRQQVQQRRRNKSNRSTRPVPQKRRFGGQAQPRVRAGVKVHAMK